ncbi:MAG: hypothetical protein JXL84_01430 [Deltaproteobacteria bacterium]|nr:hypothetical protein [Deltaproteobacteria bacterium]
MNPSHTLTDEDRTLLRELFESEVAPKLGRLQARLGNIGCEFAGPRYRNWQIHFRSRGDDFEIVDFEYDEEGCGIDLDL